MRRLFEDWPFTLAMILGGVLMAIAIYTAAPG